MKTGSKICQNCKKDFVIEVEDFNFYEKIKVPSPTFCPECRMIRRMFFRAERVLYKRKCDLCKKEIITMYEPELDVVVYCNECWWSDKWDAIDYAKDYNFNFPFFVQLKNLIKRVPKMALEGYQNKNSHFTNYTWFSKNIYLSSSTMYSENILYSHGITRCQESMDSVYIYDSQLCYECFDSQRCFNSIFLNNCIACIDSVFLYDCRGCKNCFMSSNLRNKSYVFRNIELSEKEYKNKIKEIDFRRHSIVNILVSEYENLLKNSIHRFANLFKTTVESTGDNLINVKNTKFCFLCENSENLKFIARAIEIKDSFDLYGVGPGAELLYEALNVGYKDSLIKFSTNTYNGIRNATYSDYCRNSQNIFGCIGLKKSYCILNKQYTKEEYEELIPKIIKHMNDMPYIDSKGRTYKYGEFFPSELSPFAYNETTAQEYFPLTKEEALEQGYKWKDKDERNYNIDIYNKDIPDSIKDVDNTIIGKVIECAHKGECNEQCTEAFKIIPEELQFYQRMNLPLPHLCPNCRHYNRLKQRNPLKLWHRHCMKEGCPNEFETSYSPERPEIVYCERCYQQEVY